MTEERRNEKRVTSFLPARWDSLSGMHEARLEDISLSGCFVNTAGHREIGETVSLEIELPSGQWLPLKGEVTSHQPGIGFAIQFTSLTEEEKALISQIQE
jgi:PilZ domain